MKQEQQERNLRKAREGVVVKCAMNKSITVKLERRVKDPICGKYINKTTKIMVHDEHNECAVNDRVRVEETRPLSKNKNWRLLKIVKKHGMNEEIKHDPITHDSKRS